MALSGGGYTKLLEYKHIHSLSRLQPFLGLGYQNKAIRSGHGAEDSRPGDHDGLGLLSLKGHPHQTEISRSGGDLPGQNSPDLGLGIATIADPLQSRSNE